MKILGLGSPFKHDPSAALVVDGVTIAAAEEERFNRRKHAVGDIPVNAARYCLEAGSVGIDEIDAIAFPWSPRSYRRDLLPYLKRTWRSRPSRAFKAVAARAHEVRWRSQHIARVVKAVGGSRVPPVEWVDHHQAHAASCYYLTGWDRAAILTVDGSGEFASTFFAEGRDGDIHPIDRVISPDSLGFFYSTVTEYVGFDRHDGEFKTMGMSGYGDPSAVDISELLTWNSEGPTRFRINDENVWCLRSKRFNKAWMFGPRLVEMWGPPRDGDGLSEPYIHVAAAAQKALEDIALGFLSTTLKPALERADGRLCLAGGCALNVRMNRKLLEHPLVKEIWVQPAAHDAGTPLGAALEVAKRAGDPIPPMEHAYLGPEYDDGEIRTALERFGIPNRAYPADGSIGGPSGGIVERVAELLAAGEVVAWFQGRMEFGPRALGNRSILGNPFAPGTADRINGEIKFREKWRPFCPSIAEHEAPEILDTDHPSPYMTFSFIVNPKWREKIPEAVHVDGSARPQIVTEKLNPRFHSLIQAFARRTGVPVVINTSLNRRGEPMVCSPEDALRTFFGSGLRFLALGDRLVAKDSRLLDEANDQNEVRSVIS